MVALVQTPHATDEHELLRQTLRQFVQNRVEPQAAEHDESQTFNLKLVRELGDLGLLGVTIPEADGGAGMDATASCIVHDPIIQVQAGDAPCPKLFLQR